MKSILLAVLASQRTYPVYLYHGVRDTRDLYDKECLTALAQPPLFHFTPVLSMPSQVTQYRTGFVHEAVAADFTTLEGFTVYLAGPPPMVDATTDVVVSLGVQYDNVHADPFYAAPEELPWRLNLLNAIRSVNKNIKRLATAVHSRR